MRKRTRKRSLGQSTIEYILMVAFGAVFSIKMTQFFNDLFKDGLSQLERNVAVETQTGNGFGGP